MSTSPRRVRPGISDEPIDLDGPTRRGPRYPEVEATPGLQVAQRGTELAGAVVALKGPVLIVRDHHGKDRQAHVRPGSFTVAGRQVTLVPPRPKGPRAAGVTASGSVAVAGVPARVARASRIWVEGIHDAELLEKVWGDDLRVEGIVVERLDGMDDLAAEVRRFGPRSGRRLGVLLDHLVEGTKEWRAAQDVSRQWDDVLVTGHPWVDVWAAITPSLAGLDRWPDIPMGTRWKEGVCAALGVDVPGAFWKQLLGKVSTYADLEPPLVGAVERLIDFVTE